MSDCIHTSVPVGTGTATDHPIAVTAAGWHHFCAGWLVHKRDVQRSVMSEKLSPSPPLYQQPYLSRNDMLFWLAAVTILQNTAKIVFVSSFTRHSAIWYTIAANVAMMPAKLVACCYVHEDNQVLRLQHYHNNSIAVSASTDAAATVLSQWLPRTSSSIKHKFNTDIAKSLPKVAAGSVTEINVEKLAAAIDALQSQLMMWTATTQGLPSELKVSH